MTSRSGVEGWGLGLSSSVSVFSFWSEFSGGVFSCVAAAGADVVEVGGGAVPDWVDSVLGDHGLYVA